MHMIRILRPVGGRAFHSEVHSVLCRRWDEHKAYSPAETASAQAFFRQEATFAWSADTFSRIPACNGPEVAFLGRSNDADGQVGKSSLLNALVNRKRHKLVRTSGRPGQTKTLNGFGVGSELTLVDTPGYGFGSRDAWGPLVMDFLQQRQCLKRTILLVDGMHGPKEADERLIAELGKRGIPFQVLLTKVDRLRDEAGLREMLDGVEVLVRKLGGAAVHGELLAVSSEKERTGIALLRASIARTCTLATQGPRRTQKVNK